MICMMLFSVMLEKFWCDRKVVFSLKCSGMCVFMKVVSGMGFVVSFVGYSLGRMCGVLNSSLVCVSYGVVLFLMGVLLWWLIISCRMFGWFSWIFGDVVFGNYVSVCLLCCLIFCVSGVKVLVSIV